jgi:hypothetical protein
MITPEEAREYESLRIGWVTMCLFAIIPSLFTKYIDWRYRKYVKKFKMWEEFNAEDFV